MIEFSYHRTIKFADTDAAGVVYFANLLSICHEAYEEYLATNLGIDLSKFFQDKLTAIPIIHAEIDFAQPLFCGERISISIAPQLLNDKVFEIIYKIDKDSVMVANALTRHICLNPQTRKTQSLPAPFQENFRQRMHSSFD